MLNLNSQVFPPEKTSEITSLIASNIAIEVAALVILFIIYKFIRKYFQSAIILALTVELFIFARGNLFTIDTANLTIPQLLADSGLSRYASTSDAMAYTGPQVYFNHLRVRQPFAPDLSDHELESFDRLKNELAMLPGNLNIFHQNFNALGYSAVVLNSYANFFSSTSVNTINPIDPSDPRLSQIGVNYLISGYPEDYLKGLEGFTKISDQPSVYQANQPSPRFKLNSNSASVNILSYQPNQIIISTQNTSPDQLIIFDSFYPGWQATINDQPSSITSFQGTFRQIQLPGGNNLVKLSYQPTSFKLGILISLISLFASIILFKWPNQKLLS